MISDALIREIQQLLATDQHSQRRIALRLGVARGTVRAVAAGRLSAPVEPSPASLDWEQPTGPKSRCPACGGTVYLPCRLCHVRAWQRKPPRRRARPRPPGGADKMACRSEPPPLVCPATSQT